MKIKDINRERYPMLGDRANGQTFRCIMSALYQASEGNHVFYVVNDGRMANHTMRCIADIVHVYFGESVHIDKSIQTNRIIEFPQGGFIRVVTRDVWNDRPVPTNIYKDYSVIELDDTH